MDVQIPPSGKLFDRYVLGIQITPQEVFGLMLVLLRKGKNSLPQSSIGISFVSLSFFMDFLFVSFCSIPKFIKTRVIQFRCFLHKSQFDIVYFRIASAVFCLFGAKVILRSRISSSICAT